MRRNPRLFIAIAIALFGAFSYFGSSSKNEVTGEVQRVSMTPDQEIALGLQSSPQMMEEFGGELGHPSIDQYVEAVGQRVVQRSAAARGPYKYDFHVLRDPQTVNAFALPGGQISITLGLLRRLKNEAELAGVLGHEVGHVVGRHSAEQISKQRFAQTLVGAVGVASYDPNRPMGGAQAAAMAAMVAQMVNMKYGREDELQSDSMGVQFLSQSGYDARGMIDLMKVLAEAGGGGNRPEFASSHPSPENRIARLQELIQKSGRGAGADVGAERFQQNVLAYLKQ